MKKFQIFTLILTLILIFVLMFVSSSIGSFTYASSPNLLNLIFTFTLISLILIAAIPEGMRIRKIENIGKEGIPSTIQIEVPESVYHMEGIEEVYKLLESYFPRRVYKKIVKESGDVFSLDDLKEMPYGKNTIVIRFTGKYIDEKLKRMASTTYDPHGISYGNNAVISIKSLLKVYSEIPLNKRIERMVLHELCHIAGGKDDPHKQGIEDPFLRYDPTREEIEFIKKGLEKKLYET